MKNFNLTTILFIVAYIVLVAVLVSKIMKKRRETNKVIKYVSAKIFSEIERKIQLVDVRTKEEFNTSRIIGSRNIPLKDIDSAGSKLIRDKEVYLYCASGKRASKAANRLARLGFTNIVVMKDDFNNYPGKKS